MDVNRPGKCLATTLKDIKLKLWEKGLWVLCYYGENVPIDSNYYWAITNSFTADKKPTHWAYINEPE